MAQGSTDITMVKNAIHNPAEERHFMRIAEPEYLITATLGGVELASSQRARKVKEVGFDIYDAVIYFPREDVNMALLKKNSKSTHCPLKGDTEYFDVTVEGKTTENVAWSYDRTIEPAAALKDLVGFDARFVEVVEHTAGH